MTWNCGDCGAELDDCEGECNYCPTCEVCGEVLYGIQELEDGLCTVCEANQPEEDQHAAQAP